MTAHGLEPLLLEHAFFRGLAPRDVALLAGCASNVRFAADELVFREGDPADRFFLLREGRVAVEVRVPARGSVVLQTLEAGDVLGWSWLFPPYRWTFDARALEPVRALAFDGVCLRRKCDEEPRLGYALMQRFARIVTERLQAARLQLLDVYGHVDG